MHISCPKKKLAYEQKKKLLKIRGEYSECIWCKQISKSDELTIEHLLGWDNPKVIDLSCYKCNQIHGRTIQFFSLFIAGVYSYQKYYAEMNKFMNNDRFHTIISNSKYQLSLDRFRKNPKFKYNPSNFSIYRNNRMRSMLDRMKTPQEIIDYAISSL